MSKENSPSASFPDPVRVGQTIRELRRQRHLQQGDLAALIGMQSAPLSNIENGKNHPSVRTLCRIANALGVGVNDLLYPRDYVQTAEVADRCAESTALYGSRGVDQPLVSHGIARATRIADETTLISPQAREAIQARILDHLALEDLCGACKCTAIPLNIPFAPDEDGAIRLANLVRMHCGIGSAVVFDYVELLENQGLRIHFLDLPAGVESLSFHDAVNANAFLVIGMQFNPEKQLFRMLFELANIYLFTANGYRAVDETPDRRRFSKRFASAFLMPQEAVLASVRQLGVSPSEWSYELLLRIKHRFGVSAETFAHRLEELGVLETTLRQEFKSRIHAHYRETNFGEPDSTCRVLSRNGRFADLLLCARRKGLSSPEWIALEKRAGG